MAGAKKKAKVGQGVAFADDEALAGFTERQKGLLDAALKVFNRKGYEGARTREIAGEAGVSEATLFKNFPTKRHLLSALMKPFVATVIKPTMLKSVLAILEENQDAPLDHLLREVMRDRLRLIRARLPLFRTLVLEAARQPDLLEVIRIEIIPEIAAVFKTMLDRAEARGEPVPKDRRAFMRAALSLLVGYLVLSELSPEHFGDGGDEKAIESIVHLLLNGAVQRKEGRL
jgi:AcrR family transcriptional regulator